MDDNQNLQNFMLVFWRKSLILFGFCCCYVIIMIQRWADFWSLEVLFFLKCYNLILILLSCFAS